MTDTSGTFNAPAPTKVRCVHEFCCYPAVGDFRPVQGCDLIVRTWGLCAIHTAQGR